MSALRALIVNADDFGQSAGVNRGTVAAFEQGIVTSASLMVRWPAAEEAAAYARAHPSLSLGLHFDLGEWIYRDGKWEPLHHVLPTEDADAVAEEVERQLATFRRLTSREPTHLDSHQHVHRSEPVRSLLADAARRLGAPLRHFSDGVRYQGAFYGQDGKGYPVPEAIGVEALLGLLDALPSGITELGCHPGEAGDDLETMYRHERAREVETLCDRRVRAALDERGIVLRSFAGIPAAP
jgi:chitin disaccharide deacetylase